MSDEIYFSRAQVLAVLDADISRYTFWMTHPPPTITHNYVEHQLKQAKSLKHYIAYETQ